MKVCLVSSVYPPRIGGPSTQTRHLACLLQAHGVTPLVVTFGSRNEILYDQGIKVYYLDAHEEPVIGPFWQYSHAFLRLWKIFQQERPDIVHHQTGIDYLSVLSGWVAKRMGIPSLVKYAGDLVWEKLGSASSNKLSFEEIFNSSLKARLLFGLERFALHNFDLVWATSLFQKDCLTRLLGIKDQKIVHHPNYIALEEDLGGGVPGSDNLIILSVCRFARWKRVDQTLRAFARLKQNGAVLRIIGGENLELEMELKDLAERLGIQNRVEFIGSVSPTKVTEFFKNAAVFVSSTNYEPFGITFVEAMAAGLPVVATKVGGIPEVVPDGRAGFLVAPGDIQGMADKLALLLNDPRLRKHFGEYGKKWVKRFDLREQAPRFFTIYDQLLNLKPRPGNADEDSRASQTAFLHDYYRNQEEDYYRMYQDRSRQNKQKRRLDLIKESFQEQCNRPSDIMDVGCGDGYAANYIMNGFKMRRVLGLDLSSKKLTRFLKTVESSLVLVGDGERLPLKNDSVGGILCLETLEHLIGPSAALREMNRVLKPGEIIILSIPINSPLQGLLIKAMKKLKKTRRFSEHIQSFTIPSIYHLLEKSGFKVLTQRFCGFNLPLINLVLERLSYPWFITIDNLLCHLPLNCFGVGTRFGLSLGREYLILTAQKT